MDTYRLREPLNQNENVAHETQISPPRVQRKDLLYRGKRVAED